METERIILRPLQLEDRENLLDIYSDNLTMEYTDMSIIKTIEEAEREIRLMKKLQKEAHGIRWGIYHKVEKRIIGTCGFHKWNKAARTAELGYEIWSKYWRQGYMSEIMNRLLEYGFVSMNLQRIDAYIVKENKRSLQLLLKYQFSIRDLLFKNVKKEGEYKDEYRMSLSFQEWMI